jgi:hypothetical protein
MRPTAYLMTAAGTIVLLAVITIVFTVFVDPYRMFGTPTVRGLTELKPRAFEQMGIAKTYQLERIAPKILLLGNSRTEIGLDPMSGWFPPEQRPVFNAAYAGGDVCISLLMLRNAIAVRAPEMVILGVDFQDALTVAIGLPEPDPPAASEPGGAERRLLVDQSGYPNPEREWQVWKDRMAATLTIDALLDSLRTLLNQNPARSATMTELGFNPLQEYRNFVERSGYHKLFSVKNAEYRRRYGIAAKPDFARPSPLAARRDWCFMALATLAMEHRIALILYIHPYHANFLDMLGYFGLWQSFENWKRHLVAQVASVDPGGNVIRLVDFSGYNQFTTEAVPAPGDTKSEMRWYWEPGHYKSALGEHILERIIGGKMHFGRALEPANIETVLAEIREERDYFARFSSVRTAGR